MQPPIQIVGFPDFWPTVQHAFDRQITALQSVIAFQNVLCEPPISGKLQYLIRQMVQIAAVSTSSLMILVVNGCGSDAMRLARGIYEADVNAQYLVAHPEEADGYIEFHHINNKKMVDYLDANAPALATQLTAERRAEVDLEYERVRTRFTNAKGKVRQQWCRKNLQMRAADVGLAGIYETFYNMASQLHHGEVTGLAQQSEPDTGVVIAPPSLSQVGTALINGHRALLSLLRALNSAASLGRDRALDSLDEEFRAAWESPTADDYQGPRSNVPGS